MRFMAGMASMPGEGVVGAAEPEAAPELAALALGRLERPHLTTRTAERLPPRPALARFATTLATTPTRPTGTDLFASPS